MEHKISIIIPTYCEAHNLVRLISKIRDTIKGSFLSKSKVELIVVDDNSPDVTRELCQSLADEYPETKVIIRTHERGLGTAVKRGIVESKGDILVVMDADLSHDPALIPVLVDQVANNGQDIALGSRFADGGKMRSSLPHIWGSKALNRFIRVLLQIPVKDVTGGFLALRKGTLRGINLDAIFKGYGDYCFALLYEGTKKGWRFKEIGFHYQPRKRGMSKTRFLKAGLFYGLRALKLRLG